jgi:hypothetical protein
MYKPEAVQLAVSASTTAYRRDTSSRLFRDDFRSRLFQARQSHLGAGVPEDFVRSHGGMQQDVHFLQTEAPEDGGFGRGWLLKASWDGGVGIYFIGTTGATPNATLCQEIIGPAWLAAIDLLDALGGYGPAYVAIAVWSAGHPRNRFVLSSVPRDEPGTLLDRGPLAVENSALDLRSVERELDRALGLDAFEPGS